jgi:hypothetical protein
MGWWQPILKSILSLCSPILSRFRVHHVSAPLKQFKLLVSKHFCTKTDYDTIPGKRGQLPGHGARIINCLALFNSTPTLPAHGTLSADCDGLYEVPHNQ